MGRGSLGKAILKPLDCQDTGTCSIRVVLFVLFSSLKAGSPKGQQFTSVPTKDIFPLPCILCDPHKKVRTYDGATGPKTPLKDCVLN